MDEIEDYIFTKLYDKIFPKQQSIKDFEIFRQCIKLSWITIDLLSEKKYVLDNLITSMNKYFAKTNRKWNHKQIFKIIICNYKKHMYLKLILNKMK